jgi:hypothetical protein
VLEFKIVAVNEIAFLIEQTGRLLEEEVYNDIKINPKVTIIVNCYYNNKEPY